MLYCKQQGVRVQLLHRAAMAMFVLSIGTVTFGAAFRYSVFLAQHCHTVICLAIIKCSVHWQSVVVNLLYHTRYGLVLILAAYSNTCSILFATLCAVLV
jgi:hypothetical protein